MKQSQNAITFLKAQYSAIYGRAYVKGLASVMVLSSAVAATYAQAADIVETGGTWDQPTDFNTDNYSEQQPQLTDGNIYRLDEGSYSNITANDTKYNVNLTDVQLSGTMSIASGATVNLTGSTASVNPHRTLYGWDQTGGQTEADATGDLNNSGNLNIGLDTGSSQAYYNQVTLGSGSDTIIKGTAADSNQTLDQYSTLTGGLGSGGSFTAESGSTIRIKNNSHVTVGAGSSDAQFDGTVIFRPMDSGSNSFIRVQDHYDGTTAASSDAQWGTANSQAGLKFGATSVIDVNSGASGTAGIYAPNAELGGKVTIGSGGTLRLDGDFIYDNDTAANAKHGKGNFTTTANTNINIAAGGKLVVGNGSYNNAPAYAQNAEDYQGETTVDLSNAKQITGTGNLEVQGTAILTDTLLEDFVQADTTTTTAKGGKVVLSGGTLELGKSTADNPINLGDYHISANSASRTDVDILLAGNGDDVIKGENIVVDKAFEGSVKDKLNIEADNLTLGGGNSTYTTSLNFKQATVSNNLNFKESTGTGNDKRFFLSNKVIVNAVDNGNGDKATSTGTVYLQSDTNHEPLFEVQGGELTHTEGVLGFRPSGSMSIGGVTDSGNTAYGNCACRRCATYKVSYDRIPYCDTGL